MAVDFSLVQQCLAATLAVFPSILESCHYARFRLHNISLIMAQPDSCRASETEMAFSVKVGHFIPCT